MKYTYTAVLREDGGKFYARVPDLDGCITSGRTVADALAQITDAMSAWLCVAEDERLAIPAPTAQGAIEHAPTELLSLVSADTVRYRAKTDARAVRKNVSLPAFLSSFADRQRINCSQLLQEALLARMQAGAV